MPAMPFDVAFCDTCIGGSSVATRLARPGLRAFYLADYDVNPLGTRTDVEVQAALERWVEIGAARAPVVIVACNTASARLVDAPAVRHRAQGLHVDVISMVDLLDRVLARHSVSGESVCLMGTEYTVNSPVYADRIARAGAAEVVRLGATKTERSVASLQHETLAGRELIRDEIGDCISDADTIVLACTCFPLIGDLLGELNPRARLLDPGAEIRDVVDWPERGGPSHLAIAFTGDSITPSKRQVQALFPGWDRIEIVNLAD